MSGLVFFFGPSKLVKGPLEHQFKQKATVTSDQLWRVVPEELLTPFKRKIEKLLMRTNKISDCIASHTLRHTSKNMRFNH